MRLSLLVVLLSPALAGAVPPTPTPTEARALLMDPFNLALGVMRHRTSDLPADFRALAGDDTFYSDLNHGLDGSLGFLRHDPTDAERRWAVVGRTFGYSCAMIAAAEATGLIPDKNKKKK
jgi:hypothetical protein